MVSICLPGLPAFQLAVHDKPDRFISAQLREHGVWEPVETRVMLALLDAGATFIDLGANLGYYTVLAGLRVGPHGRGFAFEPEPENFALLRRNLEVNGLNHVIADPRAASDRTGTDFLYLSPDNLGDHRLYDSGDRRGAVPVRTVTLDTFFKDDANFARGIQGLRLVKMDTQGCEALILRGAEELIAAQGSRAAWMIEFWPFGLTRSGSGAEELLQQLAGMGVNLAIVREDEGRIVPTGLHELAELARGGLHPDTGRFANLVAVPRTDSARWERLLNLRNGH